MLIDTTLATGLGLPECEFSWGEHDVVSYHLALGAGADPIDDNELRYVYEPRLRVLPTFVMTMPSIFGVAAPQHYRSSPPEIRFPGLELNLRDLLHAWQRIVPHRPVPVHGTATVRTEVTGVEDTGRAAVLLQRTDVTLSDGAPLVTAFSGIHVRGAGGVGDRDRTQPLPDLPVRAPDLVLETPTLPQQALLYRLCGERNPMHVDPEVAAAAGFERPILQGACTYGMVAKSVADAVLHGDLDRIADYTARFDGVVFPGQTLHTEVWRTTGQLLLATSVKDGERGRVLTAALTIRD
ncbi:hypothetical protein BAY61_22545 [Prauserella marina]|uniref:Acyl dehydratase n=1 Tax=Prauserella marina TaxID=530584 RepID=A0A222VTT9_9PSEU|nr:MaoC/PaaZ C-terminal domain-containing protein [Prauserella marina]ASR37318.1 hypothetical protein BAY61_22545 [Prauserella marina]PWV74828.1 acyl dehydratase [Prauserella marina]SDD39645.1 Acyl dehydratase [Prauserella marina]